MNAAKLQHLTSPFRKPPASFRNAATAELATARRNMAAAAELATARRVMAWHLGKCVTPPEIAAAPLAVQLDWWALQGVGGFRDGPRQLRAWTNVADALRRDPMDCAGIVGRIRDLQQFARECPNCRTPMAWQADPEMGGFCEDCAYPEPGPGDNEPDESEY